MIPKYSAAIAALLITIFMPVEAKAELVRFIQVVKNETPDTRFHLGELEAFQNGVVPDDLGGATGVGLTTSTNDGTLVTYGDGNLLPAIGTMDALERSTTPALPTPASNNC